MNLTVMPLGAYQTNCYCLLDGDDLALIDPGEDEQKVLDYIKESGKSPKYIFLTHGHYDHTGSVVAVIKAYPTVQVYIHKGDGEGADARMFPISGQTDKLRFMAEGDKFPFGTSEISIMETPGHSLGSVVLQFEDNLFTGDTLFCGSMGRTDFVGGDFADMMASLRRLGQLSGDFKVYPGHDRASTLEQERRQNPYVKEAMGS